jgi:hypothetical protein
MMMGKYNGTVSVELPAELFYRIMRLVDHQDAIENHDSGLCHPAHKADLAETFNWIWNALEIATDQEEELLRKHDCSHGREARDEFEDHRKLMELRQRRG